MSELSSRPVSVNGIELHYVESGHGDPLVLIHGGADDLRYWDAQVGPLSERYRVIAYSRRYAHPNTNPITSTSHSAHVEAEDLAQLITTLGLGQVHLAGASYGAYIALVLALGRADLVRTLVLGEPPVLCWADQVPGGAALVDEFMTGTWEPAGRAFRSATPELAIRILVDGIMGPGGYELLPAAATTRLMENARDMEALCTSRDAFPDVPIADVQRLHVPTLLLTGEHTTPVNRIGDRVLDRLLPFHERYVVGAAAHDLFVDNPADVNAAMLAFLAKY